MTMLSLAEIFGKSIGCLVFGTLLARGVFWVFSRFSKPSKLVWYGAVGVAAIALNALAISSETRSMNIAIIEALTTIPAFILVAMYGMLKSK